MSKAHLQRVSHLGRPLTDEEKAYLHDRSRDWEIDENDRQHGVKTNFAEIPLFTEVATPEVETEGDKGDDLSKYDENLVKQVQALNLDELRAELKGRDLQANGNKEQMQLRLIKAVTEEGPKQ